MNNYIVCIFLLGLVGCASNEKPAEIITPGKMQKQQQVVPKNPYYLVKKGDTVLSVAAQFNLKPQALLRLNKLPDGAKLVPGQRLIIKARNPQEEKLLSDDTNKPVDSLQAPEGSALQQTDVPLGDSAAAQLDGTASQQPAINSTGEYVLPVQGKVIKPFGNQPDGVFNKGINIAAPKGVPVKSVADGVIKYAGNKAEGYGKMVMIKHTDGRISTYAHLNSIDVKVDAVVSAGAKIGTVGSTGNVSQPQLQLQIRGVDKAPIDPRTLISGIGY
jgi:murein DD-endopeptidase MepM/ murein hydrolase activator NlpD